MGLPFHCNRCHAYGNLISTCSLSFKKHFKLISASRKKAVWCVKVVGKKLGVLGPNFIDEMVDINQVVHEDAVSKNLASLKPLCTSTLSIFEIPVDFTNYGGAYVNYPISCIDISDSTLGGLGFVSPLKISPVKKGYFLRSCSKGLKDIRFHELGSDSGGLHPLLAMGPSSVLSENLGINGVLRAEYASSRFHS